MENYNKKEIGVFATYYFLNNKYHRIDGPAVEYNNGTKCWWINGKLHRTDGPSIEHVNSNKEWWINDQLIGSSWNGFTEKKFEQYKKLLLLK